MPNGTFWRNKLPFKETFFYQTRNFSKKFRSFGRKTSAKLWKLNSTSPQERIERKCIWVKNQFCIVSDLPTKSFGLSARHFWRRCQTCNLTFRSTDLGKTESFFKNTVYFIFFGRSVKMFRPTGEVFSVALLKPNSECQEEGFFEKNLSNKVCPSFLDMCNIFTVAFSKRLSTCSKKKLQEKRVFLKKMYYFWHFRTFTRTFLVFWLGCQNWILRARKNVLKKLLISKKRQFLHRF